MNDFTAVAIAYTLVYAAIAGYAIFLGGRGKSLEREVRELDSRFRANGGGAR